MLSVEKTLQVELQRDYLYKFRIDSSVLTTLKRVAPALMTSVYSNVKGAGATITPEEFILSSDILNSKMPGAKREADVEAFNWKGRKYRYIKNGDSSGEGDLQFLGDAGSTVVTTLRLLQACSTYLDDNEFFFDVFIDKYDVDKTTVLQINYYHGCKLSNVIESELNKEGSSVNIVTAHMTWLSSRIN